MIEYTATHCFIAIDIVERIGLQSTLVSQINITMTNQNKIHNSHILIGKAVSLGSQKLVINLIVMDMSKFDMILNIDFLSQYKAKLDYIKKKV